MHVREISLGEGERGRGQDAEAEDAGLGRKDDISLFKRLLPFLSPRLQPAP